MNSDDPEPGPRSASPNLAAIGERGVIQRIREMARASDQRIIKGIGDDAAVIAPADRLAVTTDLLIEDVHFKLDKTPARLLGRKAMSVNLSDLAAMAAIPSFTVLGLAAPPSFPAGTLDQIVAGFVETAQRFSVSLIGGDVCRADKLVIAVTLMGSAAPPGPVYRSGARIGDLIYVTGRLGDSALGLKRLLEMSAPVDDEVIAGEPLKSPILRHLDPEPRIAAGQKLAPAAAAMIDLSDGTMSDLARVLEESHVPGAMIETARLPLSDDFRAYYRVGAAPEGEALAAALAGGEDYELLFTVRPGDGHRVESLAGPLGLALTRIGEITEGEGIELIGPGGGRVPLPAPLFAHF